MGPLTGLLSRSAPQFSLPGKNSLLIFGSFAINHNDCRWYLRYSKFSILDHLLTDFTVCQTPHSSNNSMPFISSWNSKQDIAITSSYFQPGKFPQIFNFFYNFFPLDLTSGLLINPESTFRAGELLCSYEI